MTFAFFFFSWNTKVEGGFEELTLVFIRSQCCKKQTKKKVRIANLYPTILWENIFFTFV